MVDVTIPGLPNEPNPALTNLLEISESNESFHITLQSISTLYQLISEKNSASGYAGLDSSTKLLLSQFPTGISATNIADGSVSSGEFQFLNTVTSNIQTQLDATEKSANKGIASGYAGLDGSQELLLANFASGTALQVLRRNAANTALEFTDATALAITSLNTDTTTAQVIAAGTGLGIVDAGATHTLSIDSTVATLTGTQTLTNKTLTNPTIGNFTNSGHDHQDTAGGGTLLSTSALSDTGNIAYLNTANTYSASVEQNFGTSDIVNVGGLAIGVSSTTHLLEINNSVGAATFRIEGAAAHVNHTVNSEYDINYSRTSGIPIIDFRALAVDNTSASTFRFGVNSGSTGEQSIILFDPNGTVQQTHFGTSGINSFINAQGGNLAIGDTGPNFTLDVTGDIRVSNTFLMDNPLNTFQYTVIPSAIIANRNVTLPPLLTDDTFVFENNIQNITNKTFTGTTNSFNNTSLRVSGTGALQATGTVICSGVILTDFVTINGLVYTATTSPKTGNDEFQINIGTDSDTAADLADSITNDTRTGTDVLTVDQTASAIATSTVTITASVFGTIGNGIGLASTSNPGRLTTSGSTLAGGVNDLLTIATGTLNADRTVSFPNLTADDTFVLETTSQILTNKTIDGDLNTILDINETQMKVTVGAANTVLTSGGVNSTPTYEVVPAGEVFTWTNDHSAAGFTLNKLGAITDANDNLEIDFITTASAVNYFTVTNASVSGEPTLGVAGTSTNIDLTLSTKGPTSNINLKVDGTGEYLFSETVANFLGNMLTNIADPTVSLDAVTKRYLDTQNGYTGTQGARLASTDDIDLAVASDPGNIDGFALVSGDRILLKVQDDSFENGIYAVDDPADPITWSRSNDANSIAELNKSSVFITEGSVAGGTTFLQTAVVGTIEVSPVVYETPDAIGTVGTALALTGTVLSVDSSQITSLGVQTAALDMGGNDVILGGGILEFNNALTFISVNNGNILLDVATTKDIRLRVDTSNEYVFGSSRVDFNGNNLDDLASIRDASSAELLTFTSDDNPVNYFTITNADTLVAPILSAAGSDANIDVSISPKGTGVVNINTDANLQTNKIVNLGTPTDGADAATKAYVDLLAAGLEWKEAAEVATVGSNITLSGEQTIDGVTTSASRVLVKDQTDATVNGIYLSSISGWSRTSDANTPIELEHATIFITDGTINARTAFTCTSTDITFGVTDIEFVQILDALLSPGDGLTVTSGVLNVGAGAGLAVDTTEVSLDITGQTVKAIPIDADELIIADSEDSNNLKKITIGTMPNMVAFTNCYNTDAIAANQYLAVSGPINAITDFITRASVMPKDMVLSRLTVNANVAPIADTDIHLVIAEATNGNMVATVTSGNTGSFTDVSFTDTVSSGTIVAYRCGATSNNLSVVSIGMMGGGS